MSSKTARLHYVVGPSGAGKDTLLAYARERIEAPAAIAFAHRYITRPPRLGDENHVALSAAEFATRLRAGLFALHWSSNGFSYGIGIEINQWLANGISVVVNGSRSYLSEARRRFPGLSLIWVTAPAEVLEARIARRGRESSAQALARLQRAARLERKPPQPDLLIVNDSTTADAGERLVQYLSGAQAEFGRPTTEARVYDATTS